MRIQRILLAGLALALLCGAASAFQAGSPIGPPVPGPLDQTVGDLSSGRASTAVEIAILLTVLTLLPAVLVTITSFTRIVIVLSFVRRALSVNELPPNPVLIGLSLFLTTFVMGPVAGRIWDKAYVPYKAGELTIEDAGAKAWDELSVFLVANTRKSELVMFSEMAKIVVMVVIGGFGSFIGPIVGAAPVNIVLTYLASYGEWNLAFFAAIVIVLMRFSMEGIAGLLAPLWNRLWARNG